MSASEGWRAFFDGHAPFYMRNVFTRNTMAEAEFLVRELRVEPGAVVLDLGCGTGRHSIELARRGFRMVGVDLSRGMLRQAQAAAAAAGASVAWIQADAKHFATPDSFDGAICLCEGSFGLAEAGEDPMAHDAAIAFNLWRCLRPGARLVLTALNGLRLLRVHGSDDIAAGAFDPASLTERSVVEWDSEDGHHQAIVREHGYRPEGLRSLFEAAGFTLQHLGGGTAGDWGYRPVDPDEVEIMLIATRSKRES
jgi:SAM-dependent methyltransferase